jgi:hypothetical protein
MFGKIAMCQLTALTSAKRALLKLCGGNLSLSSSSVALICEQPRTVTSFQSVPCAMQNVPMVVQCFIYYMDYYESLLT